MKKMSMKRFAATALIVACIGGGVAVASPQVALANNRVCKTVVVQKKLPWYQCISVTPGAGGLPAACYGDVTKVVCSG